VEPAWQLTHAWPPVPQREAVVTVVQTPVALQHPDGQVAAEQLEPPPPPTPDTHWPAAQTWDAPHSWQISPL
jgi:hypothetical protein